MRSQRAAVGCRWEEVREAGGGVDKHASLLDHSRDSVLALEMPATGEERDSHDLICIRGDLALLSWQSPKGCETSSGGHCMTQTRDGGDRTGVVTEEWQEVARFWSLVEGRADVTC